MMNNISIDKERYNIYQDELLLPFISHSHSEFCDREERIPITEKIKSVHLCDESLVYIDNIINEDLLHKY